MNYYVALLKKTTNNIDDELQHMHLNFLEKQRKDGNIIINGRFTGGEGGLAIYRCHSYEEAEKIVNQDPFVKKGVRTYDLYQWEMQSEYKFF